MDLCIDTYYLLTTVLEYEDNALIIVMISLFHHICIPLAIARTRLTQFSDLPFRSYALFYSFSSPGFNINY